MSCAKLRDHITRAERESLPAALQRHLEGCAACRRYAGRVEAARGLLREHRTEVEPDPGFAARVSAQLREAPAEILGWAALRLLPATLVLALVLAWFVFSATPGATYANNNEDPAPTEDLFTWVLEPSGEAP